MQRRSMVVKDAEQAAQTSLLAGVTQLKPATGMKVQGRAKPLLRQKLQGL